MSESEYGPWLEDLQATRERPDWWHAARRSLRDGRLEPDRRAVPRYLFDSFSEFIEHIRDIERRFPVVNLAGGSEADPRPEARSSGRSVNGHEPRLPRQSRHNGRAAHSRNPWHAAPPGTQDNHMGFGRGTDPRDAAESRAERYARYDREVNAARDASALRAAEEARAARTRGYPLFRTRTPPPMTDQERRRRAMAQDPAAFAREMGRSGAATALPYHPSDAASRMARASRVADGIAGPCVVQERSAITSGRRLLFQRGRVFSIAREDLQFAESTLAHAILFVVVQPMEDLYLCVASHTGRGNEILGNDPNDYVMLYDGDRPAGARPDEAAIMAHRRPLHFSRHAIERGRWPPILLKVNLRQTYDIGHAFRMHDVGILSKRASTQLGLYIGQVQGRLPDEGILDQLTGDIQLSPRSRARESMRHGQVPVRSRR